MYLHKTDLTPPGGWFFVDSDGTRLLGGSYRHLISLVIEHRSVKKLHPGSPEIEVEEQMCSRLSGPDIRAYCRSSPRGVGDLVALVAKPIAGVIDAVAGTKLKRCGSCAARRAALNKAMPL